MPETILVYIQDSLLLIGDQTAFQDTYGPAVPIVSLHPFRLLYVSFVSDPQVLFVVLITILYLSS